MPDMVDTSSNTLTQVKTTAAPAVRKSAIAKKSVLKKKPKPSKPAKTIKPTKPTKPAKTSKSTWDQETGKPNHQPLVADPIVAVSDLRPKMLSATIETLLDNSVKEALGPGNYRRISRETGYAPQHVTRVLKGTSGVSFECAIKIADSAGVSLDQLRAFLETKKPKVKSSRSRAVS